eukprot:UN02548
MSCVGQPGFSAGEKESFSKILKYINGVDSYRILHPNRRQYTWGYFPTGMYSNKGMRLDYFIMDKRLENNCVKV